MNDGIALALQFPGVFFSTLLRPLGFSGVFLITAVATACLIGGIAFGILRRKAVLLSFLAPAALSELLLVLASPSNARAWAAGGWSLLAFLILQVGLCGYLIWRAKTARLAAISLAVFNAVYAAGAALAALLALLD